MKTEKVLSIISRTLLTGIFITAGVSKIRDREGTHAFMRSKKMPLVPWLFRGAVAMELGVAPAVLMGILPRFSAPLLSAFLIPTTLIFHNPLSESDSAQKQMQTLHLLKNLAIVGGLISVALHDAEKAQSHVSRAARKSVGARDGYMDDATDFAA
jgi:putative oxidoreductase